MNNQVNTVQPKNNERARGGARFQLCLALKSGLFFLRSPGFKKEVLALTCGPVRKEVLAVLTSKRS